VSIAAISGDAPLKFLLRQKLDQLCEDGAAGIHPLPFFRLGRYALGKPGFPIQIVPAPDPIYTADLKALDDGSAEFSRTAVARYYYASELTAVREMSFEFPVML
jgi:hypothetical protein